MTDSALIGPMKEPAIQAVKGYRVVRVKVRVKVRVRVRVRVGATHTTRTSSRGVRVVRVARVVRIKVRPVAGGLTQVLY